MESDCSLCYVDGVEYKGETKSYLVKNTGNIHLVPSGDIFLDWGGKKTHVVLSANEKRSNVLPGQEKTYTTVWDDGLIVRVPKEEDGEVVTDDDGNIKYETKINFDKPLSRFRIGKYTANLLMIYDNGERDVPLEGTLSFWVIPIRLILLFIGFMFLPFIVYSVISRIRRRRKVK